MRLMVRTVAVASLLAIAAPAFAQDAGKGFLFGRPEGSFTLWGGFSHPNAGSDIFKFTTSELTLNRSDFSGLSVGGDVAYSLRPDLDLVLGVSFAGTDTRSEFRHFVDNNDLPIEQNTKFERVPITASLKWYLADRGRSVGRFAWIPSRYAPYIGAGAGLMWYRFQQAGDFVDFKTNNVFNHEYDSSSWTKTAHVLAGIDWSLSPRWSLATEGRYSWAKADLQDDFSGFKPIDLSGFTTSIGLYVRF